MSTDLDLNFLQGKFIVFEGMDGCGKSTQALLLSERMDAQGIKNVVLRDPGDTVIGERIRALLLNPKLEPLPATELFLFLAARAELVASKVKPYLHIGYTVIADRFDLSTIAYQAYGRGIPVEDILSMNGFAKQGVAPDWYIVIECLHSQFNSDENTGDRMESQTVDFYERVQAGYRDLIRFFDNVLYVGGDSGIESVYTSIVESLRVVEIDD